MAEDRGLVMMMMMMLSSPPYGEGSLTDDHIALLDHYYPDCIIALRIIEGILKRLPADTGEALGAVAATEVCRVFGVLWAGPCDKPPLGIALTDGGFGHVDVRTIEFIHVAEALVLMALNIRRNVMAARRVVDDF